jgi:hypothetical protein
MFELLLLLLTVLVWATPLELGTLAGYPGLSVAGYITAVLYFCGSVRSLNQVYALLHHLWMHILG